MDEIIDLLTDFFENPELFGVPFAKYGIAFLALLFVYFFLKRTLLLSRIYFLAAFTSRGRIARVRSNVDGDTVKVNDPSEPKNPKKKKSIRMIGVDTPESLKSMYMDIAPFGKEASDYTKKRIKPGDKVILLYDVEPYDKFGRELVYVYLASGEFYNATLIGKGYAFAAEYKPNLKYAKLFRKLETKAKNRGKRLWEVYSAKGELSKKYKKSNAYRRFKYKYEGKGKEKK